MVDWKQKGENGTLQSLYKVFGHWAEGVVHEQNIERSDADIPNFK